VFKAITPLNTKILLLIFKQETCDLNDFLASSNYNNTSYKALIKIYANIRTSLSGLYRGNLTYRNIKLKNVLLFANRTSDPLNII
jgi:hypothetical protein